MPEALVSCCAVGGVLSRATGSAAYTTLSGLVMLASAPLLVWGCGSMARPGKREREAARRAERVAVADAVGERYRQGPDAMRQSRGKRRDTAARFLRVHSGAVVVEGAPVACAERASLADSRVAARYRRGKAD